MDMKRILQALDGASTKPVVGAKDMKRFLEIVSSSSVKAEPEALTEGANPHKVSLPVQMAMQHYQQKPAKTEANKHIKTSIKKFFREVQAETAEAELKEKEEKRQLMRQYSQQIAERVLMKENATHPISYGTFTQADWDAAQEVRLQYENGWVGVGFRGDTAYVFADDVQMGDYSGWISFIYNIDTGTAEYMRTNGDAFEHSVIDGQDAEEAMLDIVMEVKERVGDTSAEMYDEMNGGIELDVDESIKHIKPKKKSDPCWSGYHQVGMKKKGNKMVPNCTKKNALKETRIIHSDDKVDVYFNPQRSKTRQAVAKRVPNHKVDAIIHTLAAKYNVRPDAFEWHPSNVTDDFNPKLGPNPGFAPGPGGPGIMNEATNIDLLRQYRAQLDEIAGPIRELVNSQHYEFEELTQAWIGINVQLETANINRRYSGDVFDAINDAIGDINKANGSVYNVYKIVEELKNSMDSDIEDYELNYDDGEMTPDLDESAMKPKITKRNPVAHAAQSVAKGSGAHKNKKREENQPRKEKHKKSPMSEELNMIMSDPIWDEYKDK